MAVNTEQRLTVKCPQCGAGPDRISRWDEDISWEHYTAVFTVERGQIECTPGEHLKHGEFVDTRDWLIHCDDCDYESSDTEEWASLVE